VSNKAILFDFGGTLNSDGDHWGVLFRERLWDEFPERSIEELEEAYIESERRLVREGLREETFRETLRLQISYQFEVLGEGRIERANKHADEFYAITVERMSEVRTLLKDLSPRYRLGIVSNFYGNLDAICNEFQLTPYLALILDSALAGVRKPDPEIWQRAITQVGFTPGETVIVGDSWKNDIAPGIGLGCKTVWYRGLEWRPAHEDQRADHQIRSLAELRELLL